MNDDEVKAWLSDDERRMWAQNGKPYMATLMRDLAETRKDLAMLVEQCRWIEQRVDAEVPQPHRPDVPGHLRGAIRALRTFTTMPRPK